MGVAIRTRLGGGIETEVAVDDSHAEVETGLDLSGVYVLGLLELLHAGLEVSIPFDESDTFGQEHVVAGALIEPPRCELVVILDGFGVVTQFEGGIPQKFEE